MKIDFDNPEAVLEDILTKINKGIIVVKQEAEWVHDDYSQCWRCSKCRATLEDEEFAWQWRNNYYCYNCGARMKILGKSE